MTTIKRKCKNCGHTQKLRNTNKKRRQWACTNCNHRNKLKLSMLALIVTLTISMGSAYAYEEMTPIPRSDYLDRECFAVIMPGVSEWIWDCQWRFTEDYPFSPDAQPGLLKATPEDQQGFDSLLIEIREYLDLGDESIPENNIGDDGVLDPVDEQAEIDPEREQAIGELEKCLRGFEHNPALGAFQQSGEIENYENKTRGEITLRDNLNKDQPTLKLLKAVQECLIIQRYLDMKVIGAEEANKAIADRLGVDYLNRAENATRYGHESLGYGEEKSASKEEIKSEADKWRDWACHEDQAHLKLCTAYQPLTGDNRGGYTEGMDCQLHGQPMTDRGGEAQKRCPMQEHDELEASAPTVSEMWEEIYERQCEAYAGQYEYLASDKRPEWVQRCYE